MKLVIDASVAVKWVVPEEHSERALQLLSHSAVRIAPDFLLLEFTNVLWKKARRGQLQAHEVSQLSSELDMLAIEFHPFRPLLGQAAEIAWALGASVHDCIYIALADVENAQLVTEDARLLRQTRGTRFEHRVVSLDHFLREP